jgi:peptidoglycan/LPS O-acetylase OafA/YrhL
VSDQKQPSVYGWQGSIVFAVVGTAISVALIIIFTELVGWVGDFWSQVIYFLALGGGIVAAALRSRRKDAEDPDRLRRGGTPITPVGLPGPFVVTQALGVLAVAMLVAGFVIGGDRGIIWIFSGIVLLLVGGVGLLFWLAGLRARRAA